MSIGPNPALNPVRFALWTLRDKTAPVSSTLGNLGHWLLEEATINMKPIFLLFFIASFSSSAIAATVSGPLVGGGGIDDMRLEVRTKGGQTVTAYCRTKCGPWFYPPDKHEVVLLKKALRGKKVLMEYVTEPNRERIAGPGFDEPVNFIRNLQFVQ